SRFVAALHGPVELPHLVVALRIARDAAGLGSHNVSPRADAQSGRQLAVLVAEDNRTNQKVIAKILERGGHRAHIVDNCEAALDALADRRFDLVLMDVNMPVMNGIEATKLCRFAAIGQRRVPIVALTADATPEMEARCTEAGMDGCVTKPIEPAQLLEIIEQV